MAVDRARPPTDAARFRERLPGQRGLALVLLPILLIGLLVFGRAALPSTRQVVLALTGGAENLPPAELKALGADELERATTLGGSGVTFKIVQRAAIHFADGSEAHPLATYLERGVLTPDGFYAEIQRGPDDPEAKPDFASGTIELRALVRAGVTWRDDGAGWYATSEPPGLGLDPATALLLPTLLRDATAPKDEGDKPVEDGTARAISAEAEVADLPGVIAVDLADFTELSEPVTFAFDDGGRLVELTVVARNTKLPTDDLVVTTVMTFAYPLLEPGLPDPASNLAPAAETGS